MKYLSYQSENEGSNDESTIFEIFKIFKPFMEILTEIFIANSVTQLSLKMREVKDKSTVNYFTLSDIKVFWYIFSIFQERNSQHSTEYHRDFFKHSLKMPPAKFHIRSLYIRFSPLCILACISWIFFQDLTWIEWVEELEQQIRLIHI